jgi:two-component system phosphate regulon sensor histidine kinase PhoR
MLLAPRLAVVLCAVLAAVAGYLAAWHDTVAAGLAAIGAVICGVAAARNELPAAGPRPNPAETATQPVDHVSIACLESAAILVDARFAIIAMNAAAVEVFGRPMEREDIRVAVRHPAVIECVTTAIRENRDSGREIEGLGGRGAVFRLKAAPAGDGRVLMSFADVSPARSVERMRADFVANASHELRTPLSTLIGFIETLQGPAAEDEGARARFLDVMANEAARMSRLVDDLLSLSRIELDRNIRPRSSVDLRLLVDDVAEAFDVALRADERTLDVRFAPDLPPLVADRDQILQVLHNLVSNAIKYGRTGTPIRVEAECEDGAEGKLVRVSIMNQGDGIPAEHIPRLTERFYRVDTGRSRRLGGTGLGLAIVKHIVERHRGMLRISSVPGESATISFTIPASLSQK